MREEWVVILSGRGRGWVEFFALKFGLVVGEAGFGGELAGFRGCVYFGSCCSVVQEGWIGLLGLGRVVEELVAGELSLELGWGLLVGGVEVGLEVHG